jgi:predicted ATPase
VRAHRVSDVELALRVGRTLGAESDDLVDIADAGLGLSQALPVLVALLVAEPGQLVLVEHPELHLHPRAVRALAGPIQRAVQRGVQVMLETHSDLLLISLQELVARGVLPPEHVQLHWAQRDERGATVLSSTTLDESGDWGEVPVDFEDIHLETVSSYLKAAIKVP